MGLEISETQKKRVAKIARLRQFFGSDTRVEIHEWVSGDGELDFAKMTDGEVEEYLKKAK